MKHKQLTHRFVRSIPKDLCPEVLYVSMEYATAIHLCCCGCGNQVVTPFSPTDWQITFNGEAVTLSPSIGNWSFPCRSHYFIRKNKVVVAESWSSKKIEAGRSMDRANKAKHYQRQPGEPGSSPSNEGKGLFGKLWNWISGDS